jgi:lipoate-protein ligase A
VPVLRVIHDGPCTGAVNMQRDEQLLAERRPDDPPVLRVYRWRPYAVTYGFHQREEDFDREAMARLGFDLVRRPTGGRAILHAEELTYCVVGPSPSPLFGDTLHSCYMRINDALVAMLRELGHDAEISGGEDRSEMRQAVCFKSAGQHEIRVAGRKIIGSAQRRTEGAFLQHGSILAGARHADLLECLVPHRRGGMDRQALLDVTTDLGRLRGAPYGGDELDALGIRLGEIFGEVLGLDLETVSWQDVTAG